MTKNNTIKCFAPSITPRIQYAFDFIFQEVMGLELILLDDETTFYEIDAVGLVYDKDYFNENYFCIASSGLLNEKSIRLDVKVHYNIVDELPAIFAVNSGDFPIDLPSMTFYLLSRYEEYFETNLDEHGRYRSENSLAFKQGFLEKPIIDLWIYQLANSLSKYYDQLYIPLLQDISLKGEIIQTFDIDFPWAYIHRPIWQNIGGLFMDIRRFDMAGLFKRLTVLFRLSKDPYDQYDFVRNSLAAVDAKAIFFMLMQKKSAFDRNHFVESHHFNRLVRHLCSWASVEIHPSYASNTDESLVTEEIKKLDRIKNKKTTMSRMHFLKLKLPNTYRTLLKNEISIDYTMGYPDRIGFRSSTSYKHRWFDLENNSISSLSLVPLIAMDTTLHTYMNLSPESATKKIKEMQHWVTKMKGNSAILWHNSSLSNWNLWKGWRDVFLRSLNERT